MTSPTPTALRAVTLHLSNPAGEVIGEFAARLVPNPGQTTDPGAFAITHGLGSLAGGTHTEVVFVDGTLGRRDLDGDGSFRDPERDALAEEVVRTVAVDLYARRWAFTYRPEQVADSVLRYGSLLRERVEVSAVEVWA
jgi:hypothetical protein